MRVVLDTNVIISALLSPTGTPAKVLGLVVDRKICVLLDDRIMAEYENVLSRVKFGFAQSVVRKLLLDLVTFAEYVMPEPGEVVLPDPEDAMFLQVALAAEADCIVTGNKRHFPASKCKGVRVLSPAEFVKEYLRTSEAAGS